jgi:hypothetical protein
MRVTCNARTVNNFIRSVPAPSSTILDANPNPSASEGPREVRTGWEGQSASQHPGNGLRKSRKMATIGDTRPREQSANGESKICNTTILQSNREPKEGQVRFCNTRTWHRSENRKRVTSSPPVAGGRCEAIWWVRGSCADKFDKSAHLLVFLPFREHPARNEPGGSMYSLTAQESFKASRNFSKT